MNPDGQYANLADRHVGLADHSFDAAEMVSVIVRIDYRTDAFFRPVLVIQLQRGVRRFSGGQRVDDDQ